MHNPPKKLKSSCNVLNKPRAPMVSVRGAIPSWTSLVGWTNMDEKNHHPSLAVRFDESGFETALCGQMETWDTRTIMRIPHPFYFRNIHPFVPSTSKCSGRSRAQWVAALNRALSSRVCIREGTLFCNPGCIIRINCFRIGCAALDLVR